MYQNISNMATIQGTGTGNQNSKYGRFSDIQQFDGNVTISSSSSSNVSDDCCDNTHDISVCCTDYDSLYDDPGYTDTGYDIPVMTTNRYDVNQNYDRLWEQENCSPVWFEQYVPRVPDKMQSRQNRITIRRDYRLNASLTLPVLSVSNMRSLMPKVTNFKNDMIEREICVAMLSEVWEKLNY